MRAQGGLLWNKTSAHKVIGITHGLNIVRNTYPWGAATSAKANGKELVSNLFAITQDNVTHVNPSGFAINDAFTNLTQGDMYTLTQNILDGNGSAVYCSYYVGVALSSVRLVLIPSGAIHYYPIAKGNYYSLIQVINLEKNILGTPVSSLPNAGSAIFYSE